MNLIEAIQLLNDLKANFEIHSRKDMTDSKNNDIVLTVNHEDGTSTVMLYDINCDYIRTV